MWGASVRYVVFALCLCFAACNKASTGFGVPALAPIVAEATPEGLKPSRRNYIEPARDVNTDAATYLSNMFQGTYAKLSGGNATGLVNAALEDLDTRLSEINTRSESSSASCLSNTRKNHRINLTAIDPVLDLTLSVQCSDEFGGEGDQSGPGSGLVFGKGTDSFSVWLYLNQSNDSDNFGYYANLTDVGKADELVDTLFLENFPTYNRVTAHRLRAKPDASTFELMYASTAANAGGLSGGNAVLGCGFKMISDGTLIFASGNAVPTGSAALCSNEQAFEICLNATDLTTATAGACNTLRLTFTMSGQVTYSELTGQGTAIDAVLPIATAGEVTTTF